VYLFEPSQDRYVLVPLGGRIRLWQSNSRSSVETRDVPYDVPSTAICTGFTSDQYKAAVKEGYAWLGGFAELRDVTWIDLPTSHWPMWSRPGASWRRAARPGTRAAGGVRTAAG
jgi:hypothetical protein